MIEVIDQERCTACNICVTVCPTNVFEPIEGSVPILARKADCQTCFMCELYCPADALYVSPNAEGSTPVDVDTLKQDATLGSYRRVIGWTEETRTRRSLDDTYRLVGH